MTMGIGAEVYERFGHNAIVVEDRRRGTSTSYNYGMFSFRQENFLFRFIQGRMLYWMQASPAEDELPRYQARRRSVWLQELNLTPAQRVSLRDFLEWNALPENRFYRYDYYLDNCSTRVRDALDKVLGGAFRAAMQGPASGTYRFHTQRLNANNLPLYTGLLLALGHGVDRPVTRWDEMFLPLKLREYLRDVTVADSTGAPVPLVKSERTLYQSDAFPVPASPPRWARWFLLAGLVLGGAFWWGHTEVAGGRGFGRVARGLAIGWLLLTGLAGAVLAGLWGLTDHVMAGWNENLLQASLLSLALGGVLLARPLGRAGRVLALIIGGLSLAGLLLHLLPVFHQVNGQILALCVPVNLGLAIGSQRVKTDPSRLGAVRLLPHLGFHEQIQQLPIQLTGLDLVTEDIERSRGRQGALVGPVLRGEGVEDVGDGHHPRLQGDRLAPDLTRVAAAVELLVVAPGDVRHLGQPLRPRDLPQEVEGVAHVALDLQPLAIVQAALSDAQVLAAPRRRGTAVPRQRGSRTEARRTP